MNINLTIDANFRIRGTSLPTIEEQYSDLWKLGKHFESIGIDFNHWYPPASTQEASLLNKAFDEHGVTTAALVLARADPSNQDRDMRSLGVWNGIDEEGGMVFTTLMNTGTFPSTFNMIASQNQPLQNWRNVLLTVQKIIEIWQPMSLEVDPHGYKSVFSDRPSVGWMAYLPFLVKTEDVPIAAALIPVMKDRRQQGTIIVSITEIFDVNNPDHIKRSHDIEIMLVDKDLLPTRAEFVRKF